MKAIRVHATGGPDVLRYEAVAQPAPGPGQALVKVEAAGVNFIDIYQRRGLYPVPLPFTPGQEAAGTVAAVGPGVADVKPGDRVAYTGVLGAYAEYGGFPGGRLVVLPGGMAARRGAPPLLRGMPPHYLASTTY